MAQPHATQTTCMYVTQQQQTGMIHTMDRLSASAVAHVHDVVNIQLRESTGHGLVDPQDNRWTSLSHAIEQTLTNTILFNTRQFKVCLKYHLTTSLEESQTNCSKALCLLILCGVKSLTN